jgi:hypothetical protein
MEDYNKQQWWIELQNAMNAFDDSIMSDGQLKQWNKQKQGGFTSGKKNASNGHCKKIAKSGGDANVKSGHLDNIRIKAHEAAKLKFSKPIEGYCKTTGELKHTFQSAKEAQRNGWDSKKIRECLKEKRKTHLGFIWKYKQK